MLPCKRQSYMNSAKVYTLKMGNELNQSKSSEGQPSSTPPEALMREVVDMLLGRVLDQPYAPLAATDGPAYRWYDVVSSGPGGSQVLHGGAGRILMRASDE